MSGYKHALTMLAQFSNSMKVQYFFNLQKELGPDQKKGTDLHLKLKEALMSPGREYNLDKNWHDH